MSSKVCFKEKELAEMHTDIKYIRENIKSLIEDTKLNNEFRIKGTTIYITLAVIGGALSSAIFWILNRVWKT